MPTMYLIIAGVALLVAVMAVILWSFVSASKKRKKEEKDFDTLMSVMPELDAGFETSTPGAWFNQRQLNRDEEKLEKAGLVHCGYFSQTMALADKEFSVWTFQDMVQVTLCNVGPSLRDDDNFVTQYWVEVDLKLEHGRSLTISNSKVFARLLNSDTDQSVYVTTKDVLKMIRKLKEHTSSERVIKIANAETHFKTSQQRKAEALWQKEVLVSEQFEDALYNMDVDITPSLLERIQTYAQAVMSASYSKQILQRLSSSPQISSHAWNNMSDRLVVVHEKMAAQDFSELLAQMVSDVSGDKGDIINSFSDASEISDPIATFTGLLDSINPTAKRIAKVSKPVVGEVYLAGA